MVVGKSIHVHFETPGKFRSRHLKTETGQADACGIHSESPPKIVQHQSAPFPEVGCPHTQRQLRSRIEKRVYADVHVTHRHVSRIKALTYTADIILVIAERTSLPVQICHLIYIVMQQKLGTLRYSLRETGMDTHRIARKMKTKSGLGKVEPVYVDTPQGLLSVRIFRHCIAQSDIYPSALDIRLVHTDRIADEIDGMAHDVQSL